MAYIEIINRADGPPEMERKMTYAIVKNSIALGRVIFLGGSHWAPAKPFTKPMTFEYRCDADAMARGLADGAEAIDLDKQPLDW